MKKPENEISDGKVFLKRFSSEEEANNFSEPFKNPIIREEGGRDGTFYAVYRWSTEKEEEQWIAFWKEQRKNQKEVFEKSKYKDWDVEYTSNKTKKIKVSDILNEELEKKEREENIFKMRFQMLRQDNKCTSDPIFLVQEKRRIYGLDSQYAPNSCYYDAENYEEVSEEEFEAAEEKCLTDITYKNPYEEVGYFDQWETKHFFFTDKAAQEYIETRSYRHEGELRIYVDSLYNNPEMKLVRDFILNYEKV